MHVQSCCFAQHTYGFFEVLVAVVVAVVVNLSKDVFKRRTSTGSDVFSLTICLDAKKLVLISFFSLIRTIYLRVSTKPPPNDAKRPLPVDVRRSKTLLLKLADIVPRDRSETERDKRGGWERVNFDRINAKTIKLQQEE